MVDSLPADLQREKLDQATAFVDTGLSVIGDFEKKLTFRKKTAAY